MTETTTDMQLQAGAIRVMRDVLLHAGFRHANSAGELVSQDDTTWISTTYTHGEYSIYVWRRPRGHGEIGEIRYVMRVLVGTAPEAVEGLGRRLKRWAKRPPKNGTWPIVGLVPTR